MAIQFVRSTKEFDDYVSKNKYLVANFTALWCQPCQQIKPVIDKLYESGAYEKIEFNRVDLDQQRDLAIRYNVSSIPTFIYLEDGKEVSRVSGANLPEIVNKLDLLAEKARSDSSAGRFGSGNSAKTLASNSELSGVSKLIPPGFEILNNSIDFGQFEALNALVLDKSSESDIRNLFKLDFKGSITVLSDADSQLLFHVPLLNISKVYSIFIKFRDPSTITVKEDQELDEEELKSETQLPNLIKVWPNRAVSFDDATDNSAAHIEKIEATEGWHECKFKFVRFQNVQNLSIFLDGDDEDYHTLIEKIIIVGVNGDSKEQAKLQKLDDE